MIVNYKSDDEGGMLVVPVVEPITDTYKVSRDHLVMEGYNEIPSEDWPKCVGSVQYLIDSGMLELVGKKGDDGEVIDQSLGELRADKARQVVKGCMNEKNVRKWINDTSITSELRALCDMQLTSILAGEEKTR